MITTGKTRRLAAALAALTLALALGGCDKCGDWFGISRGEAAGGLQACGDVSPPQK